MKVTLYDDTGRCVGIAWHEDEYGTIQLPPANRPILLTHFTVNDGPKMSLSNPVLMPIDTDFQMTISDRPIRRSEPVVAEPATLMERLRNAYHRVKEALTWT